MIGHCRGGMREGLGAGLIGSEVCLGEVLYLAVIETS